HGAREVGRVDDVAEGRRAGGRVVEGIGHRAIGDAQKGELLEASGLSGDARVAHRGAVADPRLGDAVVAIAATERLDAEVALRHAHAAVDARARRGDAEGALVVGPGAIRAKAGAGERAHPPRETVRGPQAHTAVVGTVRVGAARSA